MQSTIERVVQHVDPSVPVVRLRDMDSVFAESIRRPRLLAELLGAFAGLALLLAAIGTYGVLSYMVNERRREIGIRIALGAVRTKVLGEILCQGLQVTAVGIAVGLAGAIAVNQLLASLLFGVQPADALTIAGVVAVIATAAVIAFVIYPQSPAPAAAPNPAAGLAQVSAGANQIASALAGVPGSLKLEELNQFASRIPGWQVAPVKAEQEPKEGSGQMDQLREAVDPLGLTDQKKWKPIRELLGS